MPHPTHSCCSFTFTSIFSLLLLLPRIRTHQSIIKCQQWPMASHMSPWAEGVDHLQLNNERSVYCACCTKVLTGKWPRILTFYAFSYLMQQVLTTLSLISFFFHIIRVVLISILLTLLQFQPTPDKNLTYRLKAAEFIEAIWIIWIRLHQWQYLSLIDHTLGIEDRTFAHPYFLMKEIQLTISWY